MEIAFEALRHHLPIRTHVFKFIDRFVRGQGANTALAMQLAQFRQQ